MIPIGHMRNVRFTKLTADGTPSTDPADTVVLPDDAPERPTPPNPETTQKPRTEVVTSAVGGGADGS